MLNAKWLDTFRVLCTTGHFTKTAKILGMTQPGVSQHVQKLELQIGQPLIARQGKRFIKTAAGEDIYALSLRRHEEERALQEALKADSPDVGQITIACSGSFAMLLHPKVLALMHTAPDLLIKLEATPQNTIAQGVQDGKFDLGVIHHQSVLPQLNCTSMGVEEICLVLPKDTDLEPMSFEALQNIGYIAHPDGNAYADDLLGANFEGLYEGSDRLKLRGYINQISEIPAPVAQGLGYTILPRSGVETYRGPGQLRTQALPVRRYQELWLISRKLPKTPARMAQMAKLIQSIAARLDGPKA